MNISDGASPVTDAVQCFVAEINYKQQVFIVETILAVNQNQNANPVKKRKKAYIKLNVAE